MDLVVWSGPVAGFQIPNATIPGADEIFLGCRGDRGDWAYCPALGAEFEGSPALLLARAGVSAAQLSALVLAAFSAGGSVLRRLLAQQSYREATDVVLLSDATFTASWRDPRQRIPPPIEPFVRFALDVLDDPTKMLIATASPSPNGEFGTGVENLRSLRAEIQERSGKRFERLSGFFGIEPAPENAYRLGNVLLAEYPMEPLGHGGHPKIADQIFDRLITPFVRGGAALGTTSSSDAAIPRRTRKLSAAPAIATRLGMVAVAVLIAVSVFALARRPA